MYKTQTSYYAATVETATVNHYSTDDNIVSWLEENENEDNNTQTNFEQKRRPRLRIDVSTSNVNEQES